MIQLRRKVIAGVFLSVGSVGMFACGGSPPAVEAPAPAPEPATEMPEPSVEAPPAEPAEAPAEAKTVKAELVSKSKSKVTGSLTLTQVDDGVRVEVEISGAKPGKHGIHFHEKADCSSDDGKSAGGHFNPGGHDHALPETETRHMGDLGNIEVGADGTGKLDVVRKGATLEPDQETSLIGRGMIVHADPDDGGQPTGNAGGRIACAEIKP